MALDTGTNKSFFEYYAAASESEETLVRFNTVRRKALSLMRTLGEKGPFDVADVGCGAGTQAMLWSKDGHTVNAIDINEPLVELGRERASKEGLDLNFSVGSANDLPWLNNSIDICLVPELLEHVSDWQGCLDEFSRILRPGGLLYLSTTNMLCPMQQEFDLLLYSWYPKRLKHYYERISVTTRPELVNHAKYPAVNWFTPYSLKHELLNRDFSKIFDRFDCLLLDGESHRKRIVVKIMDALPPLRWFGHVCTPSTTVFAIKA